MDVIREAMHSVFLYHAIKVNRGTSSALSIDPPPSPSILRPLHRSSALSSVFKLVLSSTEEGETGKLLCLQTFTNPCLTRLMINIDYFDDQY
jgi:hypothetical protein